MLFNWAPNVPLKRPNEYQNLRGTLQLLDNSSCSLKVQVFDDFLEFNTAIKLLKNKCVTFHGIILVSRNWLGPFYIYGSLQHQLIPYLKLSLDYLLPRIQCSSSTNNFSSINLWRWEAKILPGSIYADDSYLRCLCDTWTQLCVYMGSVGSDWTNGLNNFFLLLLLLNWVEKI